MKPGPSIRKIELDNLILLRGIAILMVCFCHLGAPLSQGHILAKLFSNFSQYGKFGVHIFFVISGFVIPLSFYMGGYQIHDYWRFLMKRFLRLHPPYLAGLLVTLLIMFFSYKQRHMVFPEDTLSILKSLFYFHIPPDNPVFWTLIVEAQYYLFIGIFYILIVRKPAIALYIFIPILAVLSQTNIVDYVALFLFLPFFLIGTTGFLLYTKTGNRNAIFFILIGLLVFTFINFETPAFLFSLGTIIIILTSRGSVSDLLKFPGKISYSMYLIHFPIGVKLVNYLKPRIDVSYSWILFITALMVIVAASWVFYKLFEEYSERLSKKIRYGASPLNRSDILGSSAQV